jgi:hypothetical protein
MGWRPRRIGRPLDGVPAVVAGMICSLGRRGSGWPPVVPGMPGRRCRPDNGLVAGVLREGRVTANGLRFAYLEGGSGPLIMLLHGWPDTPHTWDHQLAALAGAGFRVVAPWLRGYPPTEIPEPGYFDIGTLATDVRELIRVLGGGDPCLLVGQTGVRRSAIRSSPPFLRSCGARW